MSLYNAMATKKDQLLGRSRALVGGKPLTSLSDFQETPTVRGMPAPLPVKPAAPSVPDTLPRAWERIAAVAAAEPVPAAAEQEEVVARAPDPEQQGRGMAAEAPSAESVQTGTYFDVQRRTKTAVKVVRENFRFTEELADALEKCAGEQRLEKKHRRDRFGKAP